MIAAVFSQEKGLVPCWLRQAGALLHRATPMLRKCAGWGSGQEQRRDLVNSPHCSWFIFSLRSVWPQALGFSARLICVEIPPVAHPAESGVSWPSGYGPIIPQWQMLGEIVSVGDF